MNTKFEYARDLEALKARAEEIKGNYYTYSYSGGRADFYARNGRKMYTILLSKGN